MATVPATELFDGMLDFLASTPTPEQIIAYRPTAELQHHLDELMTKKKSDVLTLHEQADLDEFMRMEHFMRMLKIRARQKLESE